MAKPVFEDLVKQQIAVLRSTSLTIVIFMPSLLLLLSSAFGIKEKLPAIIWPYVIGTLINILSLNLHKKAYITYVVLISLTLIEIIAFILVTGGIYSPVILILATLPGFAFYTSRKQGRIWFCICLLAILFIYNVNYFNIPVSQVVAEKYRAPFLFIILLLVLFLISTYMQLVKQDISKTHKSFNTASKDLEEKNIRMNYLLMLVNYSMELMCVIDMKTMTFDEVNPGFKVSLGYELSQLRGEPIKTLMKDDPSYTLLSNIKEGDKLTFEGAMTCRNGEQKKISWQTVAKNGKFYTYGRIK